MWGTESEAEPDRRVGFDCDGVVELPDERREDVRVHLVAGRSCYSVGGRLAEGPRWWRGEIRWDDTAPSIADGAEVWVRLDDGSTGRAVIEPAPAAPLGTKVIRGVGPPPFDVDAHL